MRKLLLQEDIKIIDSKIKDFEAQTGCELLVVVAKSSDPYPAAGLRFGIISGFLLSFIFSVFFEFAHHSLYAVSYFFLTLLMTWVGHFDFFKRLVLSDKEVQRETEEKAIECFYNLGSSKTDHKVTAMIMVSLLEHKIHVLVDEKLKDKITADDLDNLVKLMSEHFSKDNMTQGFLQSIDDLQTKILKAFKGKVSSENANDLKDTIQFIGFK